jgi:mersacidin/lichenicidin family type 2 lantibiotic
MSQQIIVRAWKDEEFRRSLSEAEQALLPANPAGTIDLTEAELAAADGGRWAETRYIGTMPACGC